MAYMAAFHAAQSYIVSTGAKLPKTHNGVHSEFARLTRQADTLPPTLRQFLSQAYALKNVADYEVGMAAYVPTEDVEVALDMAKRFLEWVTVAVD